MDYMIYIPEERINEIKNKARQRQWKSLAKIAEENWIDFFETDLSNIKKSSWVIFYSKDAGKYVIFIEKTDISTRKRFTFAHELWHFFLHKDYIEWWNTSFIDTDYTLALFRSENYEEMSHDEKIREREANIFASELLMPEELVKKAYFELWYNIKALSEMFFVSWQAITRRLLDLSLISN